MRSFATGKFHGWNKVTVSSHKDDYIRLLLERKRGNIKPDTHINALLLNFRLQIIFFDRNLGVLSIQHPALNPPTSKRQFTEPQSNERLMNQLGVKGLVSRCRRMRTKIHRTATERFFFGSRKGLGVVEIHPMQAHACKCR